MKKNVKVLLGGLFVLGAVSVCSLFVMSLNTSATNEVELEQEVVVEEEIEIEEKVEEDVVIEKDAEVEDELAVAKSNDEIIEEVIALAESKIGCKYSQTAEGRNGEDTFDSSGFVRYLYNETTGVDVGTWTRHQEEVLKDYQIPMADIQPGDLLFSQGHVALYVGNNEIIHASNPKDGVRRYNVFSKLNRAYRPVDFIQSQN